MNNSHKTNLLYYTVLFYISENGYNNICNKMTLSIHFKMCTILYNNYITTVNNCQFISPSPHPSVKM